MSIDFSNIYVRQFSDYVYLQVEQKESHLMNIFRKEIIKGKSDVIPRIGKVNMLPRGGNPLSQVQFSELPTSYRYISLNSWEAAVPVTKYDLDRMKIDPTNYIGQRLASAIGRQIDQVIISALLGSAATGDSGTGSAATITQTVSISDHTFDDSANVGSGNVGLTIGKLLNARAQVLAQRQSLGLPTDDLLVITNAHQAHKLMTDSRFTSWFFNENRTLEGGSAASNMIGMKLVVTEQLPQVSGNDQVIVCDSNCAVFGAPADMSPVVIEPRYDIQGKAWQVKGDLDIGAVRMEEELVVVITCAV